MDIVAVPEILSHLVPFMSFPPFSGHSHEDVHHFFAKFEQRVGALDPPTKMKCLRQALTEEAAQWLNYQLSKNSDISYQEAKKVLILRFSDDDEETRAKQSLLRMAYTADDSLANYAQKYFVLSQKSGESDFFKIINNIYATVPATIRAKLDIYVARDSLQSLEDLVDAARKVDSLDHGTNDFKMGVNCSREEFKRIMETMC